MIYLYRDLEKYGYSDYQIKKMMASKKIYMIKKGVYSDKEDFHYLEYLSKKHPNIIFTLETACQCYGLLNRVILPYKVVTKQKDRKILESNVKQIFMSDSLYDIGMNKVKYLGFDIKIYDLERLLIEVVRNKKNLDFDIYQEIISGYKKIVKLIHKDKLSLYMSYFKDSKIEYRINKEVFECI